MKYFFFFILFIIHTSSELNAQTSEIADSVTVKTETDSIYVGVLINITNDSLIIYNEEDGKMSFRKADIKYFQEGVISNSFNVTTNSSVPFYVQTARTNGRGNHYYKNYYLFGNELNYGATDNLNLTIGFETASLIFYGGLPIIQLGAKYGISAAEEMNFAISSKLYFNDNGNVLFVSTPLTFGNGRTNFTISPNYLRTSNDSEFALLSNLSLALTNKSRLIVDFGYIDGQQPLIILYEYVFKNGFSSSIGSYSVSGSTTPNLSFSIPFGKWKR